ncbi:MAG: hypothetical protein F4234_05430, partial [Gammaproteobacteria bacterium]|nr:hypothetical protein [Gammaproteobacteria bacterium]
SQNALFDQGNGQSTDGNSEEGRSLRDFNLLVSPLPINWNNYHFSDVCDRVKDPYKPVEGGATPYVGLEHLAQGIPSLIGLGTESDIKSSKTSFKNGDVLFGKLRPYLRKGVLVDFDGISSTDILVFRAREKCESGFLKYLVHSDAFIGHAKSTTSGVQHPRTSWLSLKEFRLSLPPLSEQNKIIHILSTLQRAIEAQERIIRTMTELKEALMHKLFTEGLHNEPQKQTEIGPIPESWEVVSLTETVEFIDYGVSQAIPKMPPVDGVKIVSTADIDKQGNLLYRKVRRIEVSKKIATRLKLNDGDILFNWRNSPPLIGKTTIFHAQNENHIFASFILRICTGEKRSHNYFLKYLMNHYREEGVFVKLARRAVNQANYNKNEISTLKIPKPSYCEQVEIANVIHGVEEKRQKHQDKRDVLRNLFRTFLNELMTAKTRVL